MNQLRVWMDAASTNERRQLAELAGTTLGTLHQIAGSYRNKGGLPTVRAGLAVRLEHAAGRLRKINRNLPVLVRTDLSADCRGCDFARHCLGDKAIMSDFPIMA